MKVEATEIKRNYGVDLLRLLSMFMVVLLHVLKQGGILSNSTKGINYFSMWFFECLCFGAVNCFALTSGFVSWKDAKEPILSSRRIGKYLLLWVQVVFTGIVCLSVLKLTGYDITVKDYVRALFPLTFHQYWYFSAYTALFFFIPCLNIVVNNLSKRQLLCFIVICVALFSAITTVAKYLSSDPFTINDGYSFIWLLLLYLVGAFLRKYYSELTLSKSKLLTGFVVSVLVTWTWKIGIEALSSSLIGHAWGDMLLLTYTSPTILLASVALFLVFTTIKLKQPSFVRFFAPTAFGVYLIHTQPAVFETVLKDCFANLYSFPPPLFILGFIGCSILIFVGCLMLE